MSFYYSLLGPVKYHYVQTKMFSVRYRQKSAQFIVSILIYLPPATKLCQEFCSQCLSACWDTTPIPEPDTPLGPGTPLEQTPRDQAPPLLREQSPLCSACWEIRSTRGRYASYWNAILFKLNVYCRPLPPDTLRLFRYPRNINQWRIHDFPRGVWQPLSLGRKSIV